MEFMEFSFAVVGGILIFVTALAVGRMPSLGLFGFIGMFMGIGIIVCVLLAARRNFPWRIPVFAFSVIALVFGLGLLLGPVVSALAALMNIKKKLIPETYGTIY